MAYKVFSNGDALTGSELNTYLMNQSVMVFASTTARDAALTAPTEGMVVWLQDANKYVYYTGSAWSDLITPASSGNAIINGAFDIWQRGTSFANTHAYTADRWKTDGATAVYVGTLSQLTLTPNEISGFDGAYAARLNVTNVNGATKIQFLHRVEDVRTFANQNVTLSFWAKADAARTLTLKLSQQFGSGGSTGVDTATQNASVTTSWTRFTMTFALPSIVGKTIGAGNLVLVEFNYPLSTFTVDITGVQLEAGSVATPFKRNAPSLQGELAACQRYYQKSYAQSIAPQTNSAAGGLQTSQGGNIASTNYGCFVPFQVNMRGLPTVTIYSFTSSQAGRVSDGSGTDLTAGSGTANLIGDRGFTLQNQSGGTITAAMGGFVFHWVAQAEL